MKNPKEVLDWLYAHCCEAVESGVIKKERVGDYFRAVANAGRFDFKQHRVRFKGDTLKFYVSGRIAVIPFNRDIHEKFPFYIVAERPVYVATNLMRLSEEQGSDVMEGVFKALNNEVDWDWHLNFSGEGVKGRPPKSSKPVDTDGDVNAPVVEDIRLKANRLCVGKALLSAAAGEVDSGTIYTEWFNSPKPGGRGRWAFRISDLCEWLACNVVGDDSISESEVKDVFKGYSLGLSVRNGVNYVSRVTPFVDEGDTLKFYDSSAFLKDIALDLLVIVGLLSDSEADASRGEEINSARNNSQQETSIG